jgi:hypothetical protein
VKFFSVADTWSGPACSACRRDDGREVIALAGGVRDGAALGAVQPGGASTNFLGPDCLDVPLTMEAVAEAGLGARDGRDGGDGRGHRPARGRPRGAELLPRRVVRQVRAVPVGSTKAQAILTEILERGGTAADVDERIDELEETMRLTSICGLGRWRWAR